MLRILDHGPVTELRMAASVLGRGLYWVSAFWVDGVLIDAGPPRTAAELARWLDGRPRPVLVNTHHHEDHVGGDAALGVRPLAPAASLPRLAHPPRIQLFRQLVWGRARAVEGRPLGDSLATRDLRFEVVPTPGHSDDHVVLIERQNGWAFTGDAFIHERIHYAQADEDLSAALDSLKRLLALDFAEVYCGHAGRIVEGKAAVRRKVEYLEEVRARAQELHARGLDERAIVRRLFGGLGRWHWITGGWFSELNLVRSLLGERDGP